MKALFERRWAYPAWIGLWLALAFAVWAWAVPMQIQRACWLGEWPFEEGCPDHPNGKDPSNTAAVYIKHLERNVGDGRAYARLVGAMYREKDPRLAAVLPYAIKFAPHEPMVLGVRASLALEAKDWAGAADALTTMVSRGHSEAIQLLTALMVTPESQPAVLAIVKNDARWLDTVLGALDPKVPPTSVISLISEGARLGLLNPETSLAMIDRLKLSSDWIDAYNVWVTTREKVPDGLFNGGFDQRSLRRGFDWEWPQANPSASTGMRVAQVSASPRPGSMIEIEMTGRAALPQPMISQVALLLAPRYRFKGSYSSDRLQTVDGLVWAFRCADGGDRFAQTPTLKDTQRKWLNFDIPVTVPPQCRGAVRVQLEASSPGEAKAGMAGLISFDDFDLKPDDLAGTRG